MDGNFESVGDRDVHSRVVGGDGKFMASPVEENGKADNRGAAEIGDGVECGTDGASRLENVIAENDGFTVDVGNVGFVDDGKRAA